jgi:DNA-binding NarL/FixJ family response regulator
MFSVLLAEPNLVLREKIASVLARNERIWCVIQVDGTEGLARCAGRLEPDIILADLSMIKDRDMLRFLRRCSGPARIIALVDSRTEPYMEAARRLGLDGAVDRGHACEYVVEELRALSLEVEDKGEPTASGDGGSDKAADFGTEGASSGKGA